MDVKIAKSLLEQKIEILKLSVKDERGLITSTALFDYDEDGLTIKSSSRHVMSRIGIDSSNPELDIEKSGRFTVEVDRLEQWVENVFGDMVEIHFDPDENEVRMVCDNAEGYFHSLDPDAFPTFEENYKNSEEDFTCTVRDLQSSMDFVSPFVESTASGSTTKFDVAQFEGSKSMGTNSQVLAVHKNDAFESGMRVGEEEVKKVVKFLKKKTDDKEITVKESDNVYFIEVDDGTIFGFTKPISEFPQGQNIASGLTEDEIWEISQSSFLKSIKALTATADSEDDTLHVSVTGEGEEAEIELSMEDAFGENSSSVQLVFDRLEGEGDQKKFQINHKFLEDSLELYSSDTVKGAFNDKYFKLYNETEDGDVEMCMIALNV